VLLSKTRDIDVHFEVDGIIVDETPVKQFLEWYKLWKPWPQTEHTRQCRRSMTRRTPFCALYDI